ncbi:MAG: dihydroorotate dehydrogenase (quinone), partial [Proteobacteria bacterium]|nr:dihydroorotate dehydrogenase (quinone) [Pseudomonadota bacterium]
LLAAKAAREQATGHNNPPLLVKIAPDLSDAQISDIADVVMELEIDGVIATNTTIDRPDTLASPHAAEAGGLSGQPLFEPSTKVLHELYGRTQGRIPLIGVGGVGSAAEAYAKIRAGASLVQLYSAMTYKGLGIFADIARGLSERLKADGFDNVADAVGADHR